jgi:hypothetical protein
VLQRGVWIDPAIFRICFDRDGRFAHFLFVARDLAVKSRARASQYYKWILQV